MPLYGTLDLTTVANKLPTLANLDTEAWTLPKAEVLQLLIEVPRSSTDGLLPKAMHPALPSYVILALTKYSESPVGPLGLSTFLPRHTGEVPRRGGGGGPLSNCLPLSDHHSSQIVCVAFPHPTLPRVTGEEMRWPRSPCARCAGGSR